MSTDSGEVLLSVWRDGPIVRSEWETDEGLLAALSAACSALIGQPGIPVPVTLAAAQLVSAIQFGASPAPGTSP